jgi:hypothetical protein
MHVSGQPEGERDSTVLLKTASEKKDKIFINKYFGANRG